MLSQIIYGFLEQVVNCKNEENNYKKIVFLAASGMVEMPMAWRLSL
jgi:hypothetical protein